jgi:hypothetical protein
VRRDQVIDDIRDVLARKDECDEEVIDALITLGYIDLKRESDGNG